MKISVVTIVRNDCAHIEETLKSVLEQSGDGFELEYVVIDGESDDGTAEIIQKYAHRLAFFVSEKDSGIYNAMNKGIRLATGDYLCFLNAGDELHENETLQKMVHSLHTQELPDVIYGETAIVDNQGHFLHMRRLSAPEQLNWKSFKQGMLVCHQAFFARRELAIHYLYDLQYRFSADFDWCIRIMKQAKYLHNTRLTLIDYQKEGMTTQNHKASLKERFRIMVKHYGWISTVLHHGWFVIRLFYKP